MGELVRGDCETHRAVLFEEDARFHAARIEGANGQNQLAHQYSCYELFLHGLYRERQEKWREQSIDQLSCREKCEDCHKASHQSFELANRERDQNTSLPPIVDSLLLQDHLLAQESTLVLPQEAETSYSLPIGNIIVG